MKGHKVNVVPKDGAKGGRVKHSLFSLLITVVVGIVYYYFQLPAINLQNTAFYGFFLLLAAVYCVAYMTVSKSVKLEMDFREIWLNLKSACTVPLIICGVLLLLFLAGGLLSSVIFRSASYSALLDVTDGDFSSEVEQISFDQIPMLDKDSAQRLGDRKLGELSDMVSQFEVTDDYPQINFNGRPVRVASLVYGDFFKWLNNFGDGIPAYIRIDMVNQSAEVIRLPERIKYSKSDKFFRNIDRYIRFCYPAFMFDDPHMEIDEAGTPYWICPRVVKTIGLFGGTDISGAVLVNALDGRAQYYEAGDVPLWVDQVYSADIIIEQYDYRGTYQNGYFNSLLAQKGVTVTTAGYNYIAQNDDVFIYTGITSVGGDESNVGFILTNQRTKETRFYSCAGAEEYSAMSSAQGIVQHLGYEATFPLLLNVSGQPTYFLPLKDNAGLVKMYAMVNVQHYNIVASGETVAECRDGYISLLNQQGGAVIPAAAGETITGIVEDIRSAVINGNSFYYIKLEGDDRYYTVSAAENETVVIVNPKDRVTLNYDPSEGAGIFPASLAE